MNRIFRDELPGERKSLINLVMTGYIVAISCMGYMAFYLFIQLSQMERVFAALDPQHMGAQEINVLKSRITGSLVQVGKEMVWIAGAGVVVNVVGIVYTYNMLIRPLRRMIEFAESRGGTTPPEFNSNHELKQLTTAMSLWKEEGKKG